MIIDKACSFFGHEKIEVSKELKEKVKNVIEDLIINHGVLIFLFGRFNDFIELCYYVVTDLIKKYPRVVKVKFNCMKKYNIMGEVTDYEFNKALIDEIDYCVFCYNKNIAKESPAKSETMLAYNYAKQKNKCIINII